MGAMSEPQPPSTGPDDPFGAEPGRSTSVLERTTTEEELEPGDHERFSHYVRKDKILESAVSGRPVVALCGKVWVPTRDPQRFPVCPTCKAIYEGRQGPQDGDGDGAGGGSDGGSRGGRWGFGRNKP